jgi:hypothetical protein
MRSVWRGKGIDGSSFVKDIGGNLAFYVCLDVDQYDHYHIRFYTTS